MPFLTIYRSQLALFIILTSSWYKKAKIALRMCLRNNKKMINPLSDNHTKWWNTRKQFVGNLSTSCLNVFDHFVKLALKGLMIILKGYKTTCCKTKSNFSKFFFPHWLLVTVSSLFFKAFVDFQKLTRYYRQAFIIYKNGEKLRTLTETFCQNLNSF